jgi:hypothetical protein
MGWDRRTVVVTGRVSRHNSEQDRIDDDLMEEFTGRVRAITREHRYSSLQLEMGA